MPWHRRPCCPTSERVGAGVGGNADRCGPLTGGLGEEKEKGKRWFNFKIQKLGLPGSKNTKILLEQNKNTKTTLQQQTLKKIL
jgi:hypothetical protein